MSRKFVFAMYSIGGAIGIWLYGMAGDGSSIENWRDYVFGLMDTATVLGIHWLWNK